MRDLPWRSAGAAVPVVVLGGVAIKVDKRFQVTLGAVGSVCRISGGRCQRGYISIGIRQRRDAATGRDESCDMVIRVVDHGRCGGVGTRGVRMGYLDRVATRIVFVSDLRSVVLDDFCLLAGMP